MDRPRGQNELVLKSVDFRYIARSLDFNAQINCAVRGRKVDIASIAFITRTVARTRSAVRD